MLRSAVNETKTNIAATLVCNIHGEENKLNKCIMRKRNAETKTKSNLYTQEKFQKAEF